VAFGGQRYLDAEDVIHLIRFSDSPLDC